MLLNMRTLCHEPLSPFCRKIRIILAEKGLPFELREENIWQPSDDFFQLNPAGTVPVLIDETTNGKIKTAIAHSTAIMEYLEETYPKIRLLPGSASERAECRRLVAWFDEKFNMEVTLNLLFEKIQKRYAGYGPPDMAELRIGLENLQIHLDYLSELIDKRNWLGGNRFSLADIAAASHLSAIDYLGDVPWANFEIVKSWYARIKSRPSFRPLLADRIPGMPPPRHYEDLDF